jgi:hypothetical protein
MTSPDMQSPASRGDAKNRAGYFNKPHHDSTKGRALEGLAHCLRDLHPRRRDKRQMNPLDFDAINRAALPALPAILTRLIPGGKIIGGEYVARNPTRADRHAGSFKINVHSGRWADFATGDKGGDIVSLVAYLEGVNQGKAACLLASMLGMGGSHE